MAAPMITTIVDALALFAYFSIASWLLAFREEFAAPLCFYYSNRI